MVESSLQVSSSKMIFWKSHVALLFTILILIFSVNDVTTKDQSSLLESKPSYRIIDEPDKSRIQDLNYLKKYLSYTLNNLHNALSNPEMFFEKKTFQESPKSNMNFLNELQKLANSFQIESAQNYPYAMQKFIFSVDQLIEQHKLESQQIGDQINFNPFSSIIPDIGGSMDKIAYDPLGIFKHDGKPGIFKGSPLDPLDEIKNMGQISSPVTKPTTAEVSTLTLSITTTPAHTEKNIQNKTNTENFTNITNKTQPWEPNITLSNNKHFNHSMNGSLSGKGADWYDDEEFQTNLDYPIEKSYYADNRLKDYISKAVNNVARFGRKLSDYLGWT